MIIKSYKVMENNIEYDVEEYSNGNKCWFYNEKIHRENNAAIEWAGGRGRKSWYKHGKIHREDGPARILSNSEEQYYLDGVYYPDVNSPEELLIASIII